jgi:DNA-binding transcriptional ArsR family regulator
MISALQVKAKFYRGLADPTRLAILECLLAGEKSVTQIVDATKQSQSNVSNHLKCLMDCGLVANSRSGKYIHYRIRDSTVRRLLQTGDRVVSKVYSDIARCVRYEQ